MAFGHPQSGPRTFCFQMRKGARPGRPASRAALRSLTWRRWAAGARTSLVEEDACRNGNLELKSHRVKGPIPRRLTTSGERVLRGGTGDRRHEA